MPGEGRAGGVGQLSCDREGPRRPPARSLSAPAASEQGLACSGMGPCSSARSGRTGRGGGAWSVRGYPCGRCACHASWEGDPEEEGCGDPARARRSPCVVVRVRVRVDGSLSTRASDRPAPTATRPPRLGNPKEGPLSPPCLLPPRTRLSLSLPLVRTGRGPPPLPSRDPLSSLPLSGCRLTARVARGA